MSEFCNDNDITTGNFTSTFGGFYANAIPFNCKVKKTFIILLVFQIVLVMIMYGYYRWEKVNKNRSPQLETFESEEDISDSQLVELK